MAMRRDNRESPAVLSNWIDGAPVPPQDGDFLDDLNPATGAVNAWIPRSSSKDVEQAVEAAQAALYEGPWGKTSFQERADALDAIADAIEGIKGELAALESKDTGKPVSLAARVDIPRAIANFRFFAGAIRHAGTECFPMADALNYTHRKPVGVVGLITPWNLPLYLLTWKTAPALAMGNTIVAKPSEVTPLTASLLAKIISDVGVPPGVFNLIHGTGPEAGQALVEHPDVKAISFTGGTATGAKVAATAAPMFKKLSLELGGKNPTVVFADCDFEATVEGTVRAGFANQGQVCLCGSRILIERSIFSKFVEAYVEKVEAIEVGDPAREGVQMGSLVSLEHRQKVESYLELARQEGGQIVCGGKRPTLPAPFDQGAFLEPTVITGLSPQCRTVQEEIFGPVVTVHPFEGEEEALRLANGVRYGLAASVWTRDVVKAHRFSEALQTGMVWVNTWLHRDLRVPFGGVKDSGVGREGGRYSMEFFSESSNICISLGAPRGPARPFAAVRPPDSSSLTQSFAEAVSPSAALSILGSSSPTKPKEETDPEQLAVDPKSAILDGSRTIAYEEIKDDLFLPSADTMLASSQTVDYVRVAIPNASSPSGEQPSSDDEATVEVDEATADNLPSHTLEATFESIGIPTSRRVGELIFLSGIGPQSQESGDVPGGPVRDSDGKGLDYDMAAQTRATIKNVRKALAIAGTSLEQVVDVTVFLLDVEEDLEVFERIFGSYFIGPQATRTVVGVKAFPEPVALQLKIIAKVDEDS